jgi:hypothetical protein
VSLAAAVTFQNALASPSAISVVFFGRQQGIKLFFIFNASDKHAHRSPWENGYIDSFNGKLWDELLNLEIFKTLEEAKVLIEQWRREYNQTRPYSASGYRLLVLELSQL